MTIHSLDFFVPIPYEKLPRFCEKCVAFAHDTMDCKKSLNIPNIGEEDDGSMKNQSSKNWKKNMVPTHGVQKHHSRQTDEALANVTNEGDSVIDQPPTPAAVNSNGKQMR